ncbi:hypothetical protein IWQ62_001007 [Dispira parvispora]|uniref:Uncharacterized protein n=1 Tax=Dispira parvispora TaxID=1520584 RepID=A0A9W8E9J8_9FUNG|nr:hypothetical protein IWQ62_001007 [Dispira parvispora]
MATKTDPIPNSVDTKTHADDVPTWDTNPLGQSLTRHRNILQQLEHRLRHQVPVSLNSSLTALGQEDMVDQARSTQTALRAACQANETFNHNWVRWLALVKAVQTGEMAKACLEHQATNLTLQAQQMEVYALDQRLVQQEQQAIATTKSWAHNHHQRQILLLEADYEALDHQLEQSAARSPVRLFVTPVTFIVILAIILLFPEYYILFHTLNVPAVD